MVIEEFKKEIRKHFELNDNENIVCLQEVAKVKLESKFIVQSASIRRQRKAENQCFTHSPQAVMKRSVNPKKNNKENRN